ncbi:hypothetical protein BC629DRAFT_1257540, partial [Irpex lacteus]
MRQRGMSENDKRFRTALENMRYAACTPEDLILLRTRISGTTPGRPHIGEPRFCWVSVITAKNLVRDARMDVTAPRFATSTQADLPIFVSGDSWAEVKETGSARRTQKAVDHVFDPIRSSNAFNQRIQEVLWELSPRRTNNVAGLLRLCYGMPVLLKSNEATELCATNGAEGIVVGWDAVPIEGRKNWFKLNTLFVELVKPPRTLTLTGLPQNVIPIVPSTVTFTVDLTDKQRIRVKRTQVQVLPNFAMTDFASQGRTRENNVVDLRHCQTHMSIYTALSRGSSLDGTLILYQFDESRITRGMKPDLRREFQEQEILAAATEAEFDGELPFSTAGQTRSYVISQYQAWKGIHYVPPGVHPALNWERERVNMLQPPPVPPAWKPVVAEQTKPKTKRKTEPSGPSQNVRKRARLETPNTNGTGSMNSMLGFKWDSVNWSCAYDALFTVLYNLYREDRLILSGPTTHDVTPPLERLRTGFVQLKAGTGSATPESVRDAVRELLSIVDTMELVRYGPFLTSIDRLLECLFPITTAYANTQYTCSACSRVQHADPRRFRSYVFMATSHENQRYCTTCEALLTMRSAVFTRTPSFLALELQHTDTAMPYVTVDLLFTLSEHNGIAWALGGIIYLGGRHFTCRYVDNVGRVWKHDGAHHGN